jgi:hypothetical protein
MVFHKYIVNYGKIKWDFCHYGYITKLKKKLVIMIHVCFGTFLTTCNFQCLGLKGNKCKLIISFKAMLIFFPLCTTFLKLGRKKIFSSSIYISKITKIIQTYFLCIFMWKENLSYIWHILFCLDPANIFQKRIATIHFPWKNIAL